MKKENIRWATKLYGVSCIAGIVGIFTYLSVAVLISMFVTTEQTQGAGILTVTNLVTFVLQAILFYILIYTRMYELGYKNNNAVQFGRMNADPLRGLKIGAMAAIPSVISFLVLIADKMFGIWERTAMVYRLCHAAVYPVMVWTMGTSLSTTTASLSWGAVLCAGIPVLFLPTIATLGYYLGFRRVEVWNNIVFVRKKK